MTDQRRKGDLIVTVDVVVPQTLSAESAGGRRSRGGTTDAAPSPLGGDMAVHRNPAVYVISVAAERAGMHPQTLRIYERKGLWSRRAPREATVATPTTTSHAWPASRTSPPRA